MNGLSYGEENMMICSAVLIQYKRVTDRRTDGRTDVQPIAKMCFNIAADAGNKMATVNVVPAAYRRTYSPNPIQSNPILFVTQRLNRLTWSEGRRPISATLHSSDEPSELSQ